MTSSMATQPAETSGSGLTVTTQSAPPASVARQPGCMTPAHGAQSAALILATPAQRRSSAVLVLADITLVRGQALSEAGSCRLFQAASIIPAEPRARYTRCVHRGCYSGPPGQ